MKQYIPWVISLVCCGLVCLCMMKLSDMQNQLISMQSSLNSQINTLQSNINSIYSNVDNKLEQQDNLLSASDFLFEEPRLSDGKVNVLCSVTPKVFQPEGTTAAILCNGKEYAMTLQDKQFVASIPISLYETSIINSVSFQKDGTVQTQALDWYLNPRERFLPTMFANFKGSSRGSVEGANEYVYSMDGSIDILVEQNGGLTTTVEHIDLVQYVDGREIDREEIYGKPRENSAYFGGTSAEVTSEDPFCMDYRLKEDFSCPFGSTMELYVEMRENSGITHRKLVQRIIVTADGKRDEREADFWYSNSNEANIYDAEGNLLYGIDLSLQNVAVEYK